MFRYKTNKQALIIAALVILLCLSCLTGATLALFTGNLGDGTIGIVTTSGDVKVDIVDAYYEKTLVGEALEFQMTSEHQKLLFEPGACFFTQPFKVKNVGDIPINFRLSVSDDEDIDMEKFYEAFDVWISKNPSNAADAKKITSFTGRLEVGESSESYYLLVRMKETAGNDFQGQSYSGIGVTVYAVQGNVIIKE